MKAHPVPFTLQRGSYCIIRTDGLRIVVDQKPTLQCLSQSGGWEHMDMIMLTRDGGGAILAMAVDDVGMVENKPVNLPALEIVHQFKPNYPHPIYGDAIVVDDRDFAGPDGL